MHIASMVGKEVRNKELRRIFYPPLRGCKEVYNIVMMKGVVPVIRSTHVHKPYALSHNKCVQSLNRQRADTVEC